MAQIVVVQNNESGYVDGRTTYRITDDDNYVHFESLTEFDLRIEGIQEIKQDRLERYDNEISLEQAKRAALVALIQANNL